jgi:CBS domain-containing protein
VAEIRRFWALPCAVSHRGGLKGAQRRDAGSGEANEAMQSNLGMKVALLGAVTGRGISQGDAVMKLNDFFTRNVVTAGPDESLTKIAVKMQEHNVGTVIVVENRRPVGIITDRDLALALGAQGLSPQVAVKKVMTQHVLAIPEDMGIYTATNFMRERQVRRLPIVDKQDHVVGIVTMDDLVRFVGRELYNLTEGIKHEMVVK